MNLVGIAMMNLLKDRHSCRNFDDAYVLSEQDIKVLLEAADYGPSAGGIRPYSIWHTTSRDKKTLLREAAMGQRMVSECSCVFCICAVPGKSVERYGERGELYSLQDATIAGMCLNFAAIASELDSCWIGSINPDRVREIYGMTEDHQPLSLICIGKRKT